ncbi:nicotinamide-nucleotide amidohydrolase family protein [Thauera sp. CAU 1555]|uniref:Nicotinamide-nucleotide amidohydrolase family protein n=1 Tax=Thauera sedimentorum TaxID=2767595 RepID=A0ABR9BEQ4_9RHOO|nr:nicotinamide-nucleotide amidohydrolase family protein [Thauera sedimentorum]MBC9072996.1 nicotinamide-nucleotide amidohydrolase family protein [Thauera sedimentorum]MBD8503915.1 nicotinamide-nucleotide amidohydrolase family protein [Thauera sedimentorum]
MDAELAALSRRLGEALLARRWKLASAESCTGGWIAEAVTATAGSSEWFDRGFVTYSNDAKCEMLEVSPATLAVHGAVSEATVREMVAGALAHSRADVAVAVSGVAGPSGGSAAKPVGTVCVGWGACGHPPHVETLLFTGDREAVRRQTVAHALGRLIALAGGEGPPIA